MDPVPLTVYNAPPSPAKLDRVGIFFLTLVFVWTSLLLAGVAFLIYHRNDPLVKIRGLPLSLASICMLHAYWCLGQLVYPVGATMNIIIAYDIQYFFMGIWYPLGIALFHASNLRFLRIAKLQKQYTQGEPRRRGLSGPEPSILGQVRNMDYNRKVSIFIGAGITVQILLTLTMWLACQRYHPTFGIPGTGLPDGSLKEQIWRLGQGWEWWPTLVWQFVWSWGVAPYMILKAWNIEDTLGWRTQTVGCSIASLHATPMFLVASYVRAFQPINAYFTPSNWIHLSIMCFVIFTIFVPCWQVITHQRLRRNVINSIAKRDSEPEAEFGSVITAHPKSSPQKTCISSSPIEVDYTRTDILHLDYDRLMTMDALDHVLNTDPVPLQNFSALRDFCGENVAFLSKVAQWKAASCEGWANNDQKRQFFTNALEIFRTYISFRDAEFPINLSWRQLKPLDATFDAAAKTLCGDTWEHPAALLLDIGGPLDEERGLTTLSLHEIVEPVGYDGPIPESFNAEVFDEAAAHVRELVFLNTWPKFVKELKSRRPSSATTENSGHSWSSSRTLVGKAVGYLKYIATEKSS